MDKKETKRGNGRARTGDRKDSPQMRDAARALSELFGFGSDKIGRLHGMYSTVRRKNDKGSVPSELEKVGAQVWQRVYFKCYRLRKKGATDVVAAMNEDEGFKNSVRKDIEELGSLQKGGAVQCKMESPSENPAAPWLKVEIVPWVERVKWPGAYETKLARVDLLVYGKFKMEGAAEVIIPCNGPYQIRWHLGHDSAFKPTPEAKREAESAIVEAFVRHVDAMRARFANPAWWGIEK